jgi:hypothetical protein
MRERFGADRVIIWPNIYFDGYFPGIKYLYTERGKIVGPLGDYHFNWIQEGWQNRVSPKDLTRIVQYLEEWPASRDFVEVSIRELRAREMDVDVKVSDYISDRFRHRRLFHSMNHPETGLLVEVLRRIFKFCGLAGVDGDFSNYPYHLNQIVVADFPIFRQKYRPTFEPVGLFRGFNWPSTSQHEASTAYYDFEELIRCYYMIYDREFGRS